MHPDIATVAKPNEIDGQFLDDCRFAKVVKTADGEALLIGGVVIGISAPVERNLTAAGLFTLSYAQRIATALRRIDIRQFSATVGSIQQGLGAGTSMGVNTQDRTLSIGDRVDALEKATESLGRTDDAIVEAVNRCAVASGISIRLAREVDGARS